MPINKDVILGERVVIHHPDLVNLFGCKLGDDVTVGAFVEIKKKVVIGNNVKIQAGAFIPDGVTIHDNVFIGPHVCFTNDLYPRATNLDGTLKTDKDWKVVPTIVERYASIGANVTILCGVTLGEGCMIGAGSVVTKDVAPWTLVVGNPAKVIRKIEEKYEEK